VGLTLGALGALLGTFGYLLSARFQRRGIAISIAGLAGSILAFACSFVVLGTDHGVVRQVQDNLARFASLISRWPDDGKDIYQAGDIHVAVADVRLQEAWIPDGQGRRKPVTALEIVLRIENTSATREIALAGWGVAKDAAGPSLDDGRGNELMRLPADPATNPQPLAATTLGPGQAAMDLLTFAAPDLDTQSLRLSLPANDPEIPGDLKLHIARVQLVCRGARFLGPKAVLPLRQFLHDDDRDIQLQALAAVPELGSHALPLVGDLVELLGQPDASLRRAAADALGYLGTDGRGAYAALLQSLGDPDAQVRKAVLAALTRVGPPVAGDVAHLVATLKAQDVRARLFGFDSLAAMQLNPRDAVPIFLTAMHDPASDIRRVACQALGRAGGHERDKVNVALWEALHDGDPEVRLAATGALKELGPASLNDMSLIKAGLQDDLVDVRRQAIVAMEQLGPKGQPLLGGLVALLHDPVESIQVLSAKALGQCGPAAVPELGAALIAGNDQVRCLAAQALGDIGPKGQAGIPSLTRALDDPDAKVRGQAAQALGKMADEAKVALLSLARRLKDRDPSVRVSVIQAMLAIGLEPYVAKDLIAAVAEDDSALGQAAWQALLPLKHLDEECALPLRAALQSRRLIVRQLAATLAAEMGPRASAALPELRLLLKDQDAHARVMAAQAIYCLGRQPGAVPALLEAMAIDSAEITRIAQRGLDNLKSAYPADVGELIEALASRNDQVRVLAAGFLQTLGPAARPAIGALVRVLGENDPVLRDHAATALGKIGGPAWVAAPALVAALRDKDRVLRRHAARALADLGANARVGLSGMIGVLEDPALREDLIAAMVKMGPDAVPLLVAALDDGEHYHARMAILRVLGEIGPAASEAKPMLAQLAANNKYSSIRQAAREALENIQGH
jgi:HEAT repeat protein